MASANDRTDVVPKRVAATVELREAAAIIIITKAARTVTETFRQRSWNQRAQSIVEEVES